MHFLNVFYSIYFLFPFFFSLLSTTVPHIGPLRPGPGRNYIYSYLSPERIWHRSSFFKWGLRDRNGGHCLSLNLYVQCESKLVNELRGQKAKCNVNSLGLLAQGLGWDKQGLLLSLIFGCLFILSK